MDISKKIKKELSSPNTIKAISASFGVRAKPSLNSLVCLKDTKKSSIWQFDLQLNKKTKPIVLKIYYTGKHKNKIELDIIRHRISTISNFFADIYLIEEKKDETWVFMEFIHQVRGQITVTPEWLEKFIPKIAKMHAANYTTEPRKLSSKYPFIPYISANPLFQERRDNIERTKQLIHEALTDYKLKDIILPHAAMLQEILSKGPVFFPELEATGHTLIHGDLHFQNICSYDLKSSNEIHMKLIDWETARIAPGWFDLIVLVEILMDFRKDWHSKAEQIRTNCVNLYTEEMERYGISFSTDPMKLYKMAYLQRTLEKGLATHIRRELKGRKGMLLERYLDKISSWGPEFQLFESSKGEFK